MKSTSKYENVKSRTGKLKNMPNSAQHAQLKINKKK